MDSTQHPIPEARSRPRPWPTTWPMALTVLRLALVPVFLALVARAEEPDARWAAVGVLAVMAVSDLLDGFLARRLGQTSRWGELLDPVADKLTLTGAILLLALTSPGDRYQIPLAVIALIVLKDVTIIIGTLTVRAVVGPDVGKFKARPLGKLGTGLQFGLVPASMVAPEIGLSDRLLDGLWWTAAGISIASALDYVWQGIGQMRGARAARRGVAAATIDPDRAG